MSVSVAHELKSILCFVCYFIIFVSHVLKHLEIMQTAPIMEGVVSKGSARVPWPVSCWEVGLRYIIELEKSVPWIDCRDGPVFLPHLKPRIAS